MKWMTMYSLSVFFISICLLTIPMYLSKLMKKWLEKYIIFECGMNLYSQPRKPFSLRFFLLMVLFIIFDIEIALILIVPVISCWSAQKTIFLNSFLLILGLGVMYEWKEGSLNWKM